MRVRFGVASSLACLAFLALPALAAAAPIDTPSEDRNQIMIVTALVAGALLLLAALGFLYRRAKGMIAPPEDHAPAGEHH
jgi:hypothetical protein